MPVNEPTVNPRLGSDSFGVLVLGAGDIFATRRYNTSFLLVAGERRLQIDIPSPFTRILGDAARKAKLSLSLDDIDEFIVTHIHGDHCNGGEAVAFYKRYQQNCRPKLYAMPEVLEALWERSWSGSLGPQEADPLDQPPPTLETYFEPRVLDIDRGHDFGDVFMRMRRTIHPVPCFGMIFERAGLKLGYSCDTAYDPGLVEWLSECDLIFHETSHGQGIHTPFACLKNLDRDLKRRMALTHLPDDLVCDDPDFRFTEEGRLYLLA